MLEWCERTQLHVAGLDRDRFVANPTVVDTTTKSVENIGEGAKRIMTAFPDLDGERPDLLLRSAYRMRNRLAPGYDRVNLDVLWNTATKIVPEHARVLRGFRHELTSQ